MKTLITAIAVALTMVAGSVSAQGSDALKELATTGWADNYAAEVGGLAFDEIGGSPLGFEYAVPVNLSAALAVLGRHEFLAPHIAISPNGDITVMVAPHIFKDGMLIKGGNADKDNYVVISGGIASRYDYSIDIEGKM